MTEITIDGKLNAKNDIASIFEAMVKKSAKYEDCGFGSYEFWGSKGNHVDYQWIDYAPESIIIDVQDVDEIPVKQGCTVLVGDRCECDDFRKCRCTSQEFSYDLVLDHVIEAKYAVYKVVPN